MADENVGNPDEAGLPMIELVGAKTFERMRLIIKDSRSVPLVFILPVCVPVFGPLSTGWIAIRLLQWYRINARFGDSLRLMILQPGSSISVSDIELAQRFMGSKFMLWIGALFWPVLVSGVLIAVAISGGWMSK